MAKESAPTISFETKLFMIDSWTILLLPPSASAKLPSRGQVMVEGSINGHQCQLPLEPDGRGSHWLHIDNQLNKVIQATAGDTVKVSLTATKEWPEPHIPEDLQAALRKHPKANELWQKVTPLAHWEWLRWIRSTGKAETRSHRIEVACSKLEHGERRPCCWNRNLSTEPSVSKNGVLLEPGA